MVKIYPENQKNKLYMQFFVFLASQEKKIYEEIDNLTMKKSPRPMGKQAYVFNKVNMLLVHTSNLLFMKLNYKTSFHYSLKKQISTVFSKAATHRLHQIIGLLARQTRFQKNLNA